MRQRLDEAKEAVRKARERRKAAQDAFRDAKQANDRTALGIAAGELAEADPEVETATELERRPLSLAVAGVDSAVGYSWESNIEAMDTLRHLASSSAPLREYARVGEFLTADELVGLIGRCVAPCGVRDP
jgi:hypothetical protein